MEEKIERISLLNYIHYIVILAVRKDIFLILCFYEK